MATGDDDDNNDNGKRRYCSKRRRGRSVSHGRGGVDREKTTKDRTRRMREGEFEELRAVLAELRVVLASAKAELARV